MMPTVKKLSRNVTADTEASLCVDNICNMGGNGSRGSLAHRGTVRALVRCQKPVPHHFAQARTQ